MSKADELFKSLGYEITTNNYVVEEKCIIYENKEREYIYFSLKDKEIGTYKEENLYKCGMFLSMTMQELQAINLKVKELGWIGGEDE